MPSFVDMPNVQYSYISPNKLYHEDKYRVIQIKGDNLSYLRDDPDQWEVYLKDAGGNEYIIGYQNVNVEDDSTIYVTVPTHFKIDGETTFLWPGTYGLGIRHNLIEGFYRENAIEITDNPAYMRRGFGTLLITSKNEIVYGFGDEPITIIKNYIYHFKGNQQPVVPQGEKELMRITGDIQKVSSDDTLDVYSVIPKENPVYLGGGILRITGENDEAAGIWMASDDQNAVLEDGYLKALKAGQCVLAAEIKVNDSYKFKDMFVVDMYPAPVESSAIAPAYIDNVIFEGLPGFDLMPSFNKDISDYVLEIPKELESFSIIPEVSLEGAIITINDEQVENGQPYLLTLTGEENFTIDLNITAPGKLPNGYTFNVAEVDFYTVTYDGNGNTGGDVPVDTNVYKPGQTVTVTGNINELSKKVMSLKAGTPKPMEKERIICKARPLSWVTVTSRFMPGGQQAV